MKVGAYSSAGASAWAVMLAQSTARVASHQSSPTDRPVEAPTALAGDIPVRQPSRQTFDIRV
jgi:hypothetical protein